MSKCNGLAFALALFLCQATATSLFKVGVVTPNTGIGTGFVNGLEWWRDKVNARGGMVTLDNITLEVELVTVVVSSADEAVQAFLNFQTGNPSFVHAYVNTFQQFNVAVNTALSENRIEKVLIHCSGGTPAMYGLVDLGIPRWSYQFGVMVSSSDYGTGVFRHIMSFGKRLPNTRIAFFWNTGNSFADFTCEEAVKSARDIGMEVDDSEIFRYSGADYATVMPAGVAALQASSTVMLMGCTWLDDGIALQKEIVAQKLDLIASIITIAPTTGAWSANFPRDSFGRSDGDYVLAPSQWHHTQNFSDFSSVGNTSSFAAEFEAVKGSDPDYLLASCTTAGIILERALSKVAVGSFSEASNASSTCGGEIGFDEKLRLMVRDFEEDTMYGRVRFDRFNQNVGHEAAVVQVLRTGQTSVLPASTAASSLYFPAPSWDERMSCPPNCSNPNLFRIGVLSPETPEGMNLRRGLEWWVKKSRENGGLRTFNGELLEVELIFKDTKLDNTVATEKAGELFYALTDPVQVMVNTHFMHNLVINEAMKQEQISKVLLHCTGGVPRWYGTEIDGQPKPISSYQFGVSIPATNYAEGAFSYLSKQLDNTPSDATWADLFTLTGLSPEDRYRIFFFRNVLDETANYTCEKAIEQASQAGLTVAGVFEYNASDLLYPTQLRERARTLNSEGIFLSMGCTSLEDGIELQRAFVAEEVDLFFNMILTAPSKDEWLKAFPVTNSRSNGDYVVSPAEWHHSQEYQDTSSVGSTRAFVQEYAAEYGGPPDENFAACTGVGIAIEHAMRTMVWNGAQQFDENALRIGIRDLQIDTMFGRMAFDNRNQNVGHESTVIQVIGDVEGRRTSVLPLTNSQRNIIFPAPLWELRKGCPADRPDSTNGIYCTKLEGQDDSTMTYIIIISVTVPLLSLCALYAGRASHGVLRRRREKIVQHWVQELENSLWDQDEDAVKMAEAKLRPFKGKSILGFSYEIPETSDLRREQSLQAGVGVAYLLSEEFLRTAIIATGKKEPSFYELKDSFFMGEHKVGAELRCPRDGMRGVALIDTLPRQHRQKQTHFLSWSWAYTVRQVRSGLDFWLQAANLDPGDVFLFMCFFVNNQHRIMVSGVKTGPDELDRIFEGNLCRIGKMIALLDNWQKPVYLTRIWTIFEQYVAVTKNIEVRIILPRDAEANLFTTISKGMEGINAVKESLCNVDSATAEAWSPDDQEAIHSKIQKSCGFEEINDHVRQVMIEWMGDVVIGAMKRVVDGEDIEQSAKNWAKGSVYISEGRTIEDLERVENLREIL